MYPSPIHYCHGWLHAGSGYACHPLCETLCLMTYHLLSTIVYPIDSISTGIEPPTLYISATCFILTSHVIRMSRLIYSVETGGSLIVTSCLASWVALPTDPAKNQRSNFGEEWVLRSWCLICYRWRSLIDDYLYQTTSRDADMPLQADDFSACIHSAVLSSDSQTKAQCPAHTTQIAHSLLFFFCLGPDNDTGSCAS